MSAPAPLKPIPSQTLIQGNLFHAREKPLFFSEDADDRASSLRKLSAPEINDYTSAQTLALKSRTFPVRQANPPLVGWKARVTEITEIALFVLGAFSLMAAGLSLQSWGFGNISLPLTHPRYLLLILAGSACFFFGFCLIVLVIKQSLNNIGNSIHTHIEERLAWRKV